MAAIKRHPMTSPGYVAILALHVMSVVIGFGALATTGVMCARARSVRDPFSDEVLSRYFRPGPNIAAAVFCTVPVFGAILLVVGPSAQVGRVFPWIGLCCWTLAAAMCASVVWPSEKALRTLIGAGDEIEIVRRLAHRCERGVAVVTVLGFVGIVVMIAQP